MKRLGALVLLALLVCGPLHAQVIISDGDTIAFLGDSITAGGAGFNGYGSLVMRGLKAVGIDARPIWAGVPGNTSAHMLLRLDSAVLDHKPDFVFLSAGVNDIWHLDPTLKIGVFKPSPGMGVDFEDYKHYVTQIVDRCTRAGARVILSTITPITEDPEFKTNKKSRIYNEFLKKLAEERNLPVADLNKAMFDEIARLKQQAEVGRRNMLTSDGVHPGAAGHQVMARGVLRAMGLTEGDLGRVQKQWDETPNILLFGDRQSNAGGRTGGWQHLLLDAVNAADETMGIRHVRIDKVSEATDLLSTAAAEGKTSYVMLQAPRGDVIGNTPLDAYKDSVVSFVNAAREKELKPVIITIPLRDGAGGDSGALYSSVLREVSRELDVPLADIADEMRTHYEEHPGTRLTIGDERLNHEGAKILVETILLALDHDENTFHELRETWDSRSSYTFLYSYKATFEIQLSEEGRKVIEALPGQYHGMGVGNFISVGVHELLMEHASRNKLRIDHFDREWGAAPTGTTAEEYSSRMMPSASRSREIEAYMERHGIDLSEFYSRAFKVGVYIFEQENPLGRKD